MVRQGNELAICIPTFNRAELLRATLTDLAQHQDLFDELVITDNASSDHTPDVVERCRPLFRRVLYVRHDENLGLMRNIHAALSQTRCRLQYLLSDDDRLLPEGIRAGLAQIAADPDAVAIYGGYRHIGETEDKNYEFRYTLRPERRTAQDRRRIIEEIRGAWHPLFVTEAYQRFCYYDQSMFGFWRIVDALIEAGSIWFVPDLFYVHHATPGRAELSLHEPWYRDHTRTDIDFYLARLTDDPPAPPPHGIAAIRLEHEASFLKVALADATRDRRAMDERCYLLRLRSLGQPVPEHEIAWDSYNLIGAALDRLIEQARVTRRKRLILESGTANLPALGTAISEALPGVEIVPLGWEEFIAFDAGPDDALVAESWGSFADRATAAGEYGFRWSFGDFLAMMTIRRGEPMRVLRGPNGSVHLVRA